MKKIFLLLLIFMAILAPLISADSTSFTLALENQDIGSANVWTNEANSLILNDAFSSSSLGGANALSNTLYFKNFSLGVPSGATIDGIEVQIMVSTSAGALIVCNMMNLTKAESSVGDNKCEDESITLTIILTNYTLGGPSDLWGTTWTAAEINSDGFGVQNIYRKPTGTMSTRIAEISFLRVKVYFTPETDPVNPTMTDIVDNQGEFFDSGFVDINYTLNDSNFSFGVTFDGVNQTCTNTSAQVNNGTTVNCNFFQPTFGTFNYFVWAFGSGSENNYNQSAIRTYTILEAGEFTARNFTIDNNGFITSVFWFTNKLNAFFNADLRIEKNLDVNGTAIFRDNITSSDAIAAGAGSVFNDANGVFTYGNLIPTFNETYDEKNTSRWTLNGTAIFYNDGRVGIGTGDPGQDLTVNGIIGASDNGGSYGYVLQSGVAGLSRFGLKYGLAGIVGSSDHLMLTNREALGDLILAVSGSVGGGSGEVEALRINSTTAFIGIGTSLPTTRLEVNGSITISDVGSTDDVTLMQFSEATTNKDEFTLKGDFSGLGGNNSIKFVTDLGGGDILTMMGNGNVGINTSTPTHNLNVVGSINVTEIIILGNGGILSGNSTCTFLSSPDNSTILEICNA